MRVCKLQNIQRPCIWYFQSCRTGQQFAVQLEVAWGVVQLLNPTNWKTSRGLIPVIVQAQRLKALPFSDIWDSTFYLCVPIYAHEEKLVTPLLEWRKCWGKSILPRAGYRLGAYSTVDIFNFSHFCWPGLHKLFDVLISWADRGSCAHKCVC